MRTLPNSLRRQSGIALIVSFIILLLLTIIGVSGMKVTGLEEKMAGNDRDQNLAFQSAEAALRAGEAKILALWNNTTGSIQQFCVSKNGLFYENGVPDCPPCGSANTSSSTAATSTSTSSTSTGTSSTGTNSTTSTTSTPSTTLPTTTTTTQSCSPDPFAADTWTDAKSIAVTTVSTVSSSSGSKLVATAPRYFISYVSNTPPLSGGTSNPSTYRFMVTARGTGKQDGSEVILRSYFGGPAIFAP